jgi:proton-dependent oligopeptide transporter, POT family
MTETRTSHPKGLYVLFATEMWERFSYYGMRAILVLFMTKALFFDKIFASNLYGSYTGLAYLTTLVGGYIADRYWGNRRSILTGGLLMALGQFLLFICGSIYSTAQDLSALFFYSGLGFMIIGNGFFKPNISSMVGQLYPAGDKRKDSAYTIFYMGINVGAGLGPLVCGLVGDTNNPADFKWAFLAAGIAMLLGTFIFRWLKDKYIINPEGIPVGLPPVSDKKKTSFLVIIGGIILYALVAIGILYVDTNKLGIIFPLMILSALTIIILVFSDKSLTKIERDRTGVIFIVVFFVIFFWSAFEQAGASLTFFAEEQTNRTIGSYEIPASFFQSLNSVFIILFAPVFALLWTWMGRKNIEPTSPFKMAMGLFLMAVGYLIIAFGVKDVDPTVKVSIMWITSMYAFHTFGELCLSPIGLSLVNKLAPFRFASLLMAVWFLGNAAANKLAGTLSTLYPSGPFEFQKAAEAGVDLKGILEGKITATSEQLAKLSELGLPAKFPSLLGYQITNLYEFFMVFVAMSGIASLILFVSTKKLKKMMHESDV